MKLNETDGVRLTLERDDEIQETRQVSENEWELSFTANDWRPLLIRNMLKEISGVTDESERESQEAVGEAETREQ